MALSNYINPHVAKVNPYQPGRPIEEVAREMNIDPATIAKLASNECPLGPSPKAIEAIRAAASEMHLYPDGGAYYLRHKLAEKLDVAPDQLVFGNGSNELILFIAECLLYPGSAAVASKYAFVIYKIITGMYGGDFVEVPMNGLTHDLDAFAANMPENTRVVFICNPNNPTSTLLGQAVIDKFMDSVPDDVLVVFDEAYNEICLGEMPDTMKYVREGRNAIVLRTFSKAYGLAGLRIGYGITTPEIAAMIEKPRQPFNVNRMAQIAATAAIDDDEFVKQSIEVYRNSARAIMDYCDKTGLEYEKPYANFILIKVGEGAKVFTELQKRGVIVRPMAGYQLPEWIRISFGTAAETAKLIGAFDAVMKEL